MLFFKQAENAFNGLLRGFQFVGFFSSLQKCGLKRHFGIKLIIHNKQKVGGKGIKIKDFYPNIISDMINFN